MTQMKTFVHQEFLVVRLDEKGAIKRSNKAPLNSTVNWAELFSLEARTHLSMSFSLPELLFIRQTILVCLTAVAVTPKKLLSTLLSDVCHDAVNSQSYVQVEDNEIKVVSPF